MRKIAPLNVVGSVMLVLTLVSCSAISEILGKEQVVKTNNKQRLAYYNNFLKDTLDYGIYIHTLKNKQALLETKEKFAGFPEAYVFDSSSKKGFFVSTNSASVEVSAINQQLLDSLTAIDFSLLQDFRKLVLTKTETVYAHDNFMMREHQNQHLDVYLLCNTKVGKKELKNLQNLQDLNDIATIHILDLSIEAN
ncbi:hypothetical protein [Neptunitalea lumnitzerae]|uniref:Lipoprotein n=1 Tax=Neptunitalea lumnitzerae TaxID=2965509 RepID=A0ABQ5MFS7_9FLAO|nr:hypothetical protein [Neptunitalea sp. Y10]GLB48268.1 hypothetical protein Y10_06360 [Neptunitalea sp. Y10]